MKKFLFIFILFLSFMANIHAEDISPSAKSSIIIEQSSGQILYEKNSHEKMAPASMTKIMSLLLIMESIKNKTIKWDDMVTISENASSMGGSQILLESGEEMSVKDLVKGISIASGNDAVVAMAEFISGSEELFVKKMNAKVKSLNLKDTHFTNCHGLDEENHYSSAYDMAYMARELLNYEEILDFTSIYETYLREKTDRKIWLVNTNKLVRFKKGVDGLKTGYTKTAGYCLTATMKKNNMRLIATVMGEPDSQTRNSEVSNMLDYGYNRYQLKNYINKNQEIKKVNVVKGKKNKIKIVPMEDVNILSKKGERLKPKYEIKLNNIIAPVRYGEIVGQLLVKNDGKVISKIDLTVSEDVKKANILDVYFQNIKKVITNIEN